MKSDFHNLTDRSLGTLISGLARDVTRLVRKEGELARTEVSGKISQAADGMIYLAVAVVVLLGSFMVLLDAAVYGLSEIVAPGFAALIVAIVVAVIGVLLFQKGRNDLKVKNLLPEKTLSSVKRDTNFAKENFAKEKLDDDQWNPKTGTDRSGDSTDSVTRR